jgi:chromosome segregation ATPase
MIDSLQKELKNVKNMHEAEVDSLKNKEATDLEHWKREKERRMTDLSVQLTSLTDELERKQAIIKELQVGKTEFEELRKQVQHKDAQIKKVMTHYESKIS